MALDPTRDDMLAWMETRYTPSEADEFDREEAIYWFATHYHGGQWSNLYAALCASPYSPGPMRVGCEPDSMADTLYQELVADFGS